MEHVRELVLAKQLLDQLRIDDRARDEGRPGRHVLLVAAAEIVEDDDVLTGVYEVAGYV
jgi:hypothetical protein